MKRLINWFWRKKLIRVVSYLAFMFFFLMVVGVAVLATVLKPSDFTSVAQAPVCQVNADQLLTLINQERNRLGAPSLVIDATLASAARDKFNDMVTNKYYGHTSIAGKDDLTLIQQEGINAGLSGDLNENSVTPQGTWDSFKNSPAHYRSLTDPQYTRVGIATDCTDYIAGQGTGADDNSSVVGKKIADLTAIFLATPEPTPQPQVQTQVQYVPTSPAYQVPAGTYRIPEVPLPVTTHCTSNPYLGTTCTSY